MEPAPDIYQLTNNWLVVVKDLVPELSRLGLRDFRRRKNSQLVNINAVEPPPQRGQLDFRKSRLFYNKFTLRIPLWSKFLFFLYGLFQNRILTTLIPVRGPYGLSPEQIKQLYYSFAWMYGQRAGAKSIDEIEASLAGNPADVLTVGGKTYTTSILDFYVTYAYCSKFVDFDAVDTIVELGPGSGKQVEVIKKLHPNIRFLLFDIPPQLYVCERYLATVFPDSVVSYDKTRNMESIPSTAEPGDGKIYMMGNWKFPLLDGVKTDLFWNALSFQEMEPDVVANYLKFVNQDSGAVFLQEAMAGFRYVANKAGVKGVFQPTTLDDYKDHLPNFRLADMAPTLVFGRPDPEYSLSFWRRT